MAIPCSRHFSVTDAEAAAIRAAYDYCGELSAAVARECARIIAGWKPLLKRLD